MTLRFDAVAEALIPATLVGLMFGVFMTATDFVLLSALGRALETWSVLPRGWSDLHVVETEIAAAALAAVPTGLVCWLMYRSARRSEDEA